MHRRLHQNPRMEGGLMSETGADGGLEGLLTAAIVGDCAAVHAALAANPELPRGSIHAAAALGDAEAAFQLLAGSTGRVLSFSRHFPSASPALQISWKDER
jgi:hypothetical protein